MTIKTKWTGTAWGKALVTVATAVAAGFGIWLASFPYDDLLAKIKTVDGKIESVIVRVSDIESRAQGRDIRLERIETSTQYIEQKIDDIAERLGVPQ